MVEHLIKIEIEICDEADDFYERVAKMLYMEKDELITKILHEKMKAIGVVNKTFEEAVFK